MPASFRSVTAELWSSFGETPPQLGEDEAIELETDGLKIRLEEGGDGRHLLVSAEIGPLPVDRARRAEQIRRILADNLGFLAAHRGCAHLKPGVDDPPVLMISGAHSFDERIDALHELIGDIMFLHQWHAEAMRGESASRPRFSPQRDETSNVIFHP